MKYYLTYKGYINQMSIKCYSNDELLFEKIINPIVSSLLKISECEYEMHEIVFGLSCALHIRKSSDFYFKYNNKKPLKISFKSFINTLKDIIDGEN